MSPKVKLVLAVIAGLVIGGIVNFGTIMLGPQILEYPEGMDFTNEESFKAKAHLLTGVHFMWAFLAHALGAFVGGLVAAKIAPQNKVKYALFVGVFFLIGGIKMVMDIPAPGWFVALDLIMAYIPMAWLGGKLGSK